MHGISSPFDWRKFLLVVGKAGTGKSYAIIKLQWVDKKKCPPPHYNTVVVYKRQKVPKQFRNIHGVVQINSK